MIKRKYSVMRRDLGALVCFKGASIHIIHNLRSENFFMDYITGMGILEELLARISGTKILRRKYTFAVKVLL